MVPREGIEPPTLRSSGERSTNELPRHVFGQDGGNRTHAGSFQGRHATTTLHPVMLLALTLVFGRLSCISSLQYRECVLLGRLGSNQRHVGSPVNSRAHYHSATTEQNTLCLAAPRGLEPRFPVSETGVLPA